MNQPTKFKDIVIVLFQQYATNWFLNAVKTEMKERPQVADPRTGRIYSAKKVQESKRQEGEVLCGECFSPMKYHDENNRCPKKP